VFAGRADELGRLVASTETGGSQARVVAVTGEPGIGKSRLLREFSAVAEARGLAVRWGGADEFERHVPFRAFHEALDLSDVDGAANVMDIERHRLYRAIGSRLEHVAEPAGLVLVLDDLHWADDGSRELCEYLLRHPPRGRLTLALAYRPRQANPRLSAAVEAAAAHGWAEVVELGPLPFEDAGGLIPEHVGRSTRQQLYAASGGNPLYLEMLVRDGGTGPHADPVRAALAAEFAALEPQLRVALHAAAVVGDVFEPDLAARVAGIELAAMLSATDELVLRDLVRPSRVAGRFEFRHPLVRSAAYAAAGAGWRVGAHERAAAALRGRGAPVSAQAHHVELVGRPGDPDALAVLVEAAMATVHAAPATAAHWARAALRLLPDEEDLAFARLGMLGLLARALGVTGHLAESRDVLHQVLALLPAELAEQRAQTLTFAATIEQLLGRHAEARALLLSALDSADPDGPVAATLTMGLASVQMFRADFDAGHNWAADALAAARRLGDPLMLAAALGLCAASAEMAPADRAAYVGEAAGLVDALTDGDLAGRLEAAVWLAWAEMLADRFDDSLRHLERGLRVARATGQNHLVTYLLMAGGSTYGLTGQLAAAAESFDDALEVALLTGSDELRTMALASQSWITAWRGDLAEALRLGEQAMASAQRVTGWYTSVACAMSAQARIYAGQLDGTVDAVLATCGGAELAGLDLFSRPSWYELFAYADTAAGRADRAQEWADRASAAAGVLDLPVRIGFAKLAHAHAQLLVDPAESARSALDAAASFAASGDRVDAGRAYLRAATAYAAMPDVESARGYFARATALFQECGAELFLQHAAREQRRMNARRPRRRADAETTLTDREEEIAKLVVMGLTNRQIAERLYLSPRTVEVHVARLLAKLGVATRAAVANALTDGDRL
jgi:DNA-binding NarL/FixJ family response regulator